MPEKVVIIANGDLRLSANQKCWPAQAQAEEIVMNAIRLLLSDDVTDQTIHPQVFQTLRYLLEQRLAIGRPVTYIDATNLTPEERRPYIEIARAHGCEIDAVFFNVPLEVCRERNARRNRVPRTCPPARRI